MDGLAKRLESENKALKREIAELRSSCVHRSELEELKEDLDRLKKSSPDIFGCSPGIYSRVKTVKKGRPQSLHEVTQAMQDQLAKPPLIKEYSYGSLPPFYFTLENFAHHKKHSLKWYSTPFYSHPGGYKMCVGVSAGGSGAGEGTHVSVLLHFLRGEFDNSLEWPFRGTVAISLLNECRDGCHHGSEVVYCKDVSLKQSGRVSGSVEKSVGYGTPLFIAHAQLGTIDCEYLKQDRLRFVLETVKLN